MMSVPQLPPPPWQPLQPKLMKLTGFLFQPNCDLPHLPFPRDDSELVFGAQGDHRGLATIATTSSGSRTMTLKEDEDMSYQSVSPYDGKVLKTFEELTDKQLEMALEIAATCF